MTTGNLFFQYHDILNDLLNNNFVKSINMIKGRNQNYGNYAHSTKDD